MPIRRVSPRDTIRKALEDRVKEFHQRLIMALHKAGLEATTEARERHRYLAQTGNLQSSVGYCIVDNGKIVGDVHFETKSGQNGDGKDGAAKGESFIKSIASQHSEGLVLIIVAGMPYATYVEAMGLNVLDSARIKAGEEAAEGIKRAIKSVWQ